MKFSELIKVVETNISENIKNDFDIKISTDTRTIQAGDFYLPLKGASFDGEKFIEQALQKGAIGAFYTKKESIHNISVQEKILIEVSDTLETYLKLANYRRNTINPKVVAITGSSGKTTTKEIVSATLQSKFKVFKTPLNHNNEIGFCQTLFEMPDNTEVLVLEMGMRGLGEIELLSKYAEPDITIISNVGTAHIGRLQSRENIAKAKCEIVKHQRGKYFIAHDNELIKNTVEFSGEKIFYSINNTEILDKEINYSKFKYKDEVYELNVSGDFNIENALAAINTALCLGLNIKEIQTGLKQYKPIEKRWEATKIGGFEIINDSYNANPESMRAFINTVTELYNDYLIILGDMGELGENEVQYHKELGKYIAEKNLSGKILTIGTLSKNISEACNGTHFETIQDAVNHIKAETKNGTKIFLKASRSMKFEQIIDFLKL